MKIGGVDVTTKGAEVAIVLGFRNEKGDDVATGVRVVVEVGAKGFKFVIVGDDANPGNPPNAGGWLIKIESARVNIEYFIKNLP